ncbi:hypothetical protein NDU88_007328 [Pleurodeles waltl]|uniref:Uncharacterized protein n=1 Tax=Pleurodeles waltl TaxID=8319 RepID=A0AAV7N1S1_PLEWA|nr:hypothetical protein NDU88_007328 [Pleurodeles waltl]
MAITVQAAATPGPQLSTSEHQSTAFGAMTNDSWVLTPGPRTDGETMEKWAKRATRRATRREEAPAELQNPSVIPPGQPIGGQQPDNTTSTKPLIVEEGERLAGGQREEETPILVF